MKGRKKIRMVKMEMTCRRWKEKKEDDDSRGSNDIDSEGREKIRMDVEGGWRRRRKMITEGKQLI